MTFYYLYNIGMISCNKNLKYYFQISQSNANKESEVNSFNNTHAL